MRHTKQKLTTVPDPATFVKVIWSAFTVDPLPKANNAESICLSFAKVVLVTSADPPPVTLTPDHVALVPVISMFEMDEFAMVPLAPFRLNTELFTPVYAALKSEALSSAPFKSVKIFYESSKAENRQFE